MPVETPEYWLRLLARPEAVVGGISTIDYLWNVVHSNSNCHDWSYACKGRESHLHSTITLADVHCAEADFCRIASVSVCELCQTRLAISIWCDVRQGNVRTLLQSLQGSYAGSW